MMRYGKRKILAILSFLVIAAAMLLMALPGVWRMVASACGTTSAPVMAATPQQRPLPAVVGWVEYVRLDPGSAVMKAKLDVGALTSSLDVRELQRFRKQGQDWVRFTYLAGARAITVERALVRNSMMKMHGGGLRERPVVRLTIQLGDFCQETEVNLADRQNFLYPLLLGRRFLEAAQVSVDSNRTFTCRSKDYDTQVPPVP